MNFKAYSQKGLYLLALLCLAGAGCNKKNKIEETQTPEPMVLIIETNEEFIASEEAKRIEMINETSDKTNISGIEKSSNDCDDLLPICEK